MTKDINEQNVAAQDAEMIVSDHEIDLVAGGDGSPSTGGPLDYRNIGAF